MSKLENIPTYAQFKKKFGSTRPSLILPIKGFWLEKIWVGEKLEEYRNQNSFYEKRLEKFLDWPHFTVGFLAGYSEEAPFAVCKCDLQKGPGFEKWGAQKGKNYYVLRILKVYK